MAEFSGTEAQQRLQARVHEKMDWIRSTPGACNTGRMLGTDDPGQLGLDTISSILEQDGFCGFRMIPATQWEALNSAMLQLGYRMDLWNVFSATREEVLSAASSDEDHGLPAGYDFRTLEKNAAPDEVAGYQALMQRAGIVPFSGEMLRGAVGPAATVGIVHIDDGLVACAHTYFSHNATSPFHRWAWGGLVAVDERHRGRKLGVLINRFMVAKALDLGAEAIYEIVGATNTVSRKMVEASGLSLNDGYLCGIATRSEERFTR